MVLPSRVGLGWGWPNPKLGLGFTNPIWVEKGPDGLFPEMVKTRGRASTGADGQASWIRVGVFEPLRGQDGYAMQG